MVLSDSLAQSKRQTLFAGLPSLSETDKKIYFQVSSKEMMLEKRREEEGGEEDEKTAGKAVRVEFE